MERSTCVENGINPKAVYDFVVGCREKKLGLDAFMLLKGGKVVAEGYYAPYDRSTRHVLYSMSKSFTATAIGFAMADGLLALDDPISRFFPAYRMRGLNRRITVRHLLTMQAGKLVPMTKIHKDKDHIRKFLQTPFLSKPGKRFTYISDNYYVLSVIIGVVTGRNTAEYLYEKLFAPLGIEKPLWETDAHGNCSGGWGLYLSIEDQAKVWQCYANGGKWEGRQVIPADWIAQATDFQTPTVRRGQIDVTKGYGLGFWRLSLPNSYRAYGLHGQYGYVFEDRDTVLVVNAGISKDFLLAAEINKMYRTLWDAPDVAYERKLAELLADLGDKDNLPIELRNERLEEMISNMPMIPPKLSGFASMLHATMTTVMYKTVGHMASFQLTRDADNELYLLWKEKDYVNKIKLGFSNRYECSPFCLAGIEYHAYAKAAWTKAKVLTVYFRIAEGCHLRILEFDFSGKYPVIRNNSFPDMPSLAVYYLDFLGFPLPELPERLLMRHIAPAILLVVEPNFRVRIKGN